MRIIVRLLAVILTAILSVIVFALDQDAKFYSVVAGWFYILLDLCAVITIIEQNGIGLAILGGMFGVTTAILIGSAVITGFIEELRDCLLAK